MDVLATTDGGATFTVTPLPEATAPEVTQAELDAVAGQITLTDEALAALRTLVEQQEAADQAGDAAEAARLDALAATFAQQEAADKVEDDQQTADIRDLANRIGSGPAGSNPENAILLDSFTGTDDQKLDQAFAVAQASNPRRPIRLAARNHTFTKTRQTFNGLRILGPNIGWQNPEISGTGGSLPQCSATLNCGTGVNSWLVGVGTTYDVVVAGICFKSSNGNTQFYHHPYSAGTSYATRLDTLTFYGFKHVLGLPSDAFSATLNTWAGDWSVLAPLDVQFSLRGSDNWFCPSSMNFGWAGSNGGKYLMRFSNVSKTSVKNLYLTCRGGSRAILVENNGQGGLDFSDCVIEGQNAGDPAMGALIVSRGGASFTNIRLNFAMYRPTDYTDQTDTAMVMVQGGACLLTNVWVCRANGVPESVPVVQVSGGVARLINIMGVGSWTGLPQAVRTGGTLTADNSVRTFP